MIIETIEVIKSGYGSKLNKLSEDHETLTLVSEYTKDELEAIKQDPTFTDALIYVIRELWGERHDYLKPLHDVPKTVGHMFGGNTGKLSDGSILKIHDRYETQKQYDMYSR